jgi:hypothetical protein
MTNNLPDEYPTRNRNVTLRAPHSLGHVTDDWAASDVWLKTVEDNSRNRSKATVNTYRFYLAKLRWSC